MVAIFSDNTEQHFDLGVKLRYQHEVQASGWYGCVNYALAFPICIQFGSTTPRVSEISSNMSVPIYRAIKLNRRKQRKVS